MGYFETFGSNFSGAIAGFAQGTATALIENLTVPITLCLTIYFVCKGYLIIAGRIQDSMSDLMLACGKIALVSLFALNTGYFIGYVLPAIQGLENFFVSAFDIIHGQEVQVKSAWAAIDNLWFTFLDGLMEVWNLMSLLGFSDIGAILTVFVATAILAIGSVFFTFSALGVLLINEICLTITLGFGPVFLCCLMFPVTRTWFDGWLKSSITYIFTIIIAAAVMMLFTSIFTTSIHDIKVVAMAEATSEQLSNLFVPLLNFTVLALVAAATIRMVPSVAAGMTGGVAMQAVGVGQMFSGIGRGMATMTGAGLVGMGASLGAANLKQTGRQMLHGHSLGEGDHLAASALGASVGAGIRGAKFIGDEFIRGSGNGSSKTTVPLWERGEHAENVFAQTSETSGSEQRSFTNSQKASAIAQAIPEHYRADPNFSCPLQYQNWSTDQFKQFATENPAIQHDANFSKAFSEASKAEWRQKNLGPTSSVIPEAYRADPSWTCPERYANADLLQLRKEEKGYDGSIPEELTKAIEEAEKREWRLCHFGPAYE